jgi:hypothetical protein
MEHDDGVRGWGENLRPLVNRIGTSATNKYLKDPIPSRPQPANASVPNFPSAATNSDAPINSSPAAGNFDGRILAVQKEISAIKSGLLHAHKTAMVRSGKVVIGAASAHGPSESNPSLANDDDQYRPVVLGLLAEPHNQHQGEGLLCIEAADQDIPSGDLKKRKRAKAVCNKNDVESLSFGVDSATGIGSSLGNGRDVVMTTLDNPLYDENNVTAGPDDQACREP